MHDIKGAQDYRMLARKLSQPLYFTGPDAKEELDACMEVFSHGHETGPTSVQVMMGRELPVPIASGSVAEFSFAELCEKPVAAADYIALCSRFHTVLLHGVPAFHAGNRAGAYRFVTLVDVVYEERCRLIIAAETEPPGLFARIVTQSDYRERQAKRRARTRRGRSRQRHRTQTGRAPHAGCRSGDDEGLCVDDNVGFAKDRTVSRLIEMQSLEYARAHAERHAPELLPSLAKERRAPTPVV